MLLDRCALSSLLICVGLLSGCSENAASVQTPGSAGMGGGSAGSVAGVGGTAPTAPGGAGAAGAATGGTGGDALGGGGAGGVTGGSGGTAGAAGSAGTGGTTSADACAGAVYCDDFDTYAAPGNPGGDWVTSVAYSGNMNGMVSVDTAHAYSGTKSIHFKTPGSTSFEHAFITLQGAPHFPVPDNVLFGRMMIYVTQLPSNTVHWTMIQGLGTVVPGQPTLNEAVYRYGGQINGDQLMANYDTKPTSSDCAQRATTKMPRSKWTCVEWRFDGKLKELDFWMDGVQNDALSVRQKANNTGVCQNKAWSGTWEPPTFNAIGVGFQHYQQAPGELWIDDFAIDTKKLGCPPESPGAK
jgi:hypothetical protein